MTLSAGLSDRQVRDGGGRSIFNEDAIVLEGNLTEQIKLLIEDHNISYPNIQFEWKKTLSKSEISPESNYTPHSSKSGVKPDGGILFAVIKDNDSWWKNGKRYPILVTEAKKQGTNHERVAIKELYNQGICNDEIATRLGMSVKKVERIVNQGNEKQAKGNAIERAFKNWAEFQIYFEEYDYFPYVIFAYGCDFEDGSSINDRLDAMTRYKPRNKEYIFDPKQLATIYIQDKPFTNQEIFDRIKLISTQVIEHIINA
tara:strand:- start:398 stop:1168 length:771 start_codon:yes stop_codon:yes gene_type:complete